MNRFTLAAIAAVTATGAHAAGLDRSNQSILPLFDPSDTLSFSVSHVNPDLTGQDVDGDATYDAGNSYTAYSYSYAKRLNDRFSYAIIGDQPFGADIFYDADPDSSALGGTKADLSSDAINVLGRYEFGNRFSVFGGIRAERAGGEIALNGQAYRNAVPAAGVAGAINANVAAATGSNPGITAAQVGGALQFAAGLNTPETAAAFNTVATAVGGAGNFAGSVATPFAGAQAAFDASDGYSVDIEQSWGLGLTAGIAYEIPDIALRLVVTYHSEIGHDGDTTEVLGPAAAVGGLDPATELPGTVQFASPQSINVDFQTGINPKTLVLASYRWTDWDDFDVIPQFLANDLADLDDGHRWSVGVARRFTDEFVGLATLTYEKDNGSASVSPLGPTDGQIGLSIGGRYTSGAFNVSGGVNYTKIGDAFAGVAGQPVAAFEDNSAIGVGLKLSYEF